MIYSGLSSNTNNRKKNQIFYNNIVNDSLSVFEFSKDIFLNRTSLALNENTTKWFKLLKLYFTNTSIPLGIFVDHGYIAVFLNAENKNTLDFEELENLLIDPHGIKVLLNKDPINITHVSAGIIYALSVIIDNSEMWKNVHFEFIHNDSTVNYLAKLFEKYYGQYQPAMLITFSTK